MKAQNKTVWYVVACCALVAAAGVGYFVSMGAAKPASYYAIEPETKVRPARFEELKFKLEPGVDVRAPASVEH